MNLCVFDIPEETAELAVWLETQLTGLDLGNLVAELSAIHGVPTVLSGGIASQERPDEGALEKSLGRELPAILRSGLQNVPHSQLRVLLRNPQLLLDLQERILSNGGDYWRDKFSREHASSALLEKVWSDLEPALAAPIVAPARHGLKWTVRVLMVLAASIMGFAAGLHFFRPPPPKQPADGPVAQTGWGWNKPDAFPNDLDPQAYFQRLADGADEWFKKRPETREALETRIAQFRKGCDALQQAEHEPLRPEDKAWLKERCKLWSDKLDQHLADLRAGKDVSQVRSEADATINKLVTALRTRIS